MTLKSLDPLLAVWFLGVFFVFCFLVRYENLNNIYSLQAASSELSEQSLTRSHSAFTLLTHSLFLHLKLKSEQTPVAAGRRRQDPSYQKARAGLFPVKQSGSAKFNPQQPTTAISEAFNGRSGCTMHSDEGAWTASIGAIDLGRRSNMSLYSQK